MDHKKVLETAREAASFHLTERDYETSVGERRSYLKERTKQREYLNSQIVHLDKLLKDNSINGDTYARYKKLLEIRYAQKRKATREKHGFINPITLT